MQVTLNIEAGQLGDTVVELFENIPQEKKEALAFKIMEKWIEAPLSIEREAIKAKVLKRFQDKKETNYSGKLKTDEDIMSHYSFREALQRERSSKEIMIQKISKELTDFYQKKVKELVEESPTVNNVLKQVLAKAEKDFPQLVQQAMTAWFSNHIHEVAAMAANQPVAQATDDFGLNNRF